MAASRRFAAAILFQQVRLQQIRKLWLSATFQRENTFPIEADALDRILAAFENKLEQCNNSTDLLLLEATMTKALYKMAVNAVQYGDFTRSNRGNSTDIANRYLDHGNYLAYGLAATACWVIGLPHGLAVLHGKTRRGGLVFDIADLIKDSIVLPNAFIAAMAGDDEQEFRQRCLNGFRKSNALDVMFDAIKETAQAVAK